MCSSISWWASISHVLRADTYLGYPQLYPNDRIQEQVQALEFEQALPNMWIRFECDSLESATEVLLDEEIRAAHARSVLEGTGGYAFTATSKTRVDVPFTADRVCASVVVKIPPGVDSDAFHAAMDVMFDKIVALPVFQKNALTHTYWRIDQTNKIAHYLPGLEHPEPEIVIVTAEFGVSIAIRSLRITECQWASFLPFCVG
ncbi:hypothetical protein B0H14DRAFT_409856 [Mycena olivaceomarginata]|nr:hypothetical protein B0H14DRAFT_409856 [Mycena olivaceomarginata]